MDAPALVLTEKQERALRRMERLSALRRARRSGWRAVGWTLVKLFPVRSLLGAFFVFGYLIWMNRGERWPMIGFFSALFACSLLCQYVLAPMLRRIEELERLLEEELKREPRL